MTFRAWYHIKRIKMLRHHLARLHRAIWRQQMQQAHEDYHPSDAANPPPKDSP